ncbi:MAG TPA: GWxTD domain-containing protein [Bacteroidota bacterium]|nr:GWxTD domain-containing protein [Bacteroidota bacterium]
MIEVLDSTKHSTARRFVTHEVSLPKPPISSSDSAFHAGIVSFDLNPGAYTVVLEVNDKNSSRKFRDNSRRITLTEFSQNSIEISDPIFFEMTPGQQSTKHVPFFLGGDIPFGSNAQCYFSIRAPFSEDTLHVSYSLRRSTTEEATETLVVREVLPPRALEPAKALVIGDDDDIAWYTLSDSILPRCFTGSFDIKMDTVPQGTYQLEIVARAGSSTAVVKKEFQLRWLGMPLSLRQIKSAVEVMAYILPEDEFNRLRSSSQREQRKFLEDYWKHRDPTPGTSFNEVLAEYYKRVDYASRAFGRIGEENGTKTERGKAYVLYGPPSEIERRLLPSSDPEEVWLYAALRKKLIFVDEHRNGEYKLVATESL